MPSEAHGAPACAARCGQRCRLRFCGHQILDRGLHRRSVIDNERPGRTQLTQWYRQLSEKDNGREGRNSRAVRRCGALPARSLLAPDGLIVAVRRSRPSPVPPVGSRSVRGDRGRLVVDESHVFLLGRIEERGDGPHQRVRSSDLSPGSHVVSCSSKFGEGADVAGLICARSLKGNDGND